MSNKYLKPDVSPQSPNGLYRADSPDNFKLPSCGIEDVDRAVFKLFDEQIPLFFKSKENTKRIPVIFATGERAFILRRQKPLTDRHGALILPLVSILRSGLEQAPTAGGFGVGPGNGTMEISRRKFVDSIDVFNETNSEGLLNQANVVNSNKHLGPSLRNYRRNVSGPVIKNQFSSPVTEIISMPSPRYFSATYEITFWAQYLQQMNDMLEAVMSTYNINPAKSFRLESDKGYWFVGFVADALTGDLNFDSMTEAERIVKYNFSISVNGYIINPEFPGSLNLVRRTLSAPKVSFDTKLNSSAAQTVVGVISGKPEHYQNSDLEHIDEPLPGSGIGGVKLPSAGITATAQAQNVAGDMGISGGADATIGGSSTSGVNGSQDQFTRLEKFVDPFTGEIIYKRVLLKTKNSRYGEKVHNLITLND
jgi:hypothetical protein